MKRCLCILNSLDAGGAETFLMKMYRILPTEEYQFDFVVSKDQGCYTEEVVVRGGKIFVVPPRSKNLVRAFQRIKSIVRENQYDHILKLGENSLAVVDLIAAKLGGARYVAVRSCNAPTGLSFKTKCAHLFFRPLLNRIATVKLAPSKLAAEFMFGTSSDVKLLNNGVNLRLFHYDMQNREKIREEFCLRDQFVVGHIGRFNKQKNHRYLLEVFGEMSKRRDDAVLLLVGAGEDHDKICQWISELSLEDKVILAGQRFDIPQILSAMDVFVFPSLYEGMPNTVIEAQAAGLPCVIADTITREANITGLVQYLPLSLSPVAWADVALNAVSRVRKDTTEDFLKHGYDIDSVVRDFLSIMKLSSESKD